MKESEALQRTMCEEPVEVPEAPENSEVQGSMALSEAAGVPVAMQEANGTENADAANQGVPVPPEKHALERMERRRELKPLYEYCAELRRISEGLSKEMFLELMLDRVVLLTVNLGAGVNGFSAMYFDFLMEEGMLPGEGGGAEIRLNEQEGKGLSLTEAKRFVLESGGTMFSIDLTAWVNQIEKPEFREFLLFLYSQAESYRYVFRIPYLEKRMVKRVAAILSDIFTVDTISLPPIRQQDIRETAAALLSEYGYTATEEAMAIFERRLTEERSDGRFYGMSTVEKVIREMVVEKLRRKTEGEEERLIYAADIEQILAEEKKEKRNPKEELESRVGMEKISTRLEEILRDMEGQKNNASYYNIRFVGNPGTGRTETARLFGEMMQERGMLSQGGFLEYRGEELLGTVQGETTPKTMIICRDAEGCVLFIDGLSLREKDEEEEEKIEQQAFRREAIETLLSQVQQDPGAFLLIFAGTKEEMEALVQDYPEIETLFPYVVEFPDYTKAELLEIYRDMARRRGMSLSAEAEQELQRYFKKLPEQVLREAEFANGRFVRNLFERTVSKVSLRAELYGTEAEKIYRSDLLLAVSREASVLNQREVKKYPMGFRLRDL